jgi:hypothetical protein
VNSKPLSDESYVGPARHSDSASCMGKWGESRHSISNVTPWEFRMRTKPNVNCSATGTDKRLRLVSRGFICVFGSK